MDPYEKLCNKDPRNPLFNDLYGYEDEKPVPRGDCACDNCFYGRDAMALEIIRLQEKGRDAASFHKVMRCLRAMKKPHGTCQPRERKACTNCNAKDELEQMMADYKGQPIYPA